MAAVSRRNFLTHASAGVAAGVATAGGLTAIGGLTAARYTSPAPASGLQPLGEHMIVHVRDVATGEISIMAGTSEIVYRDSEVVARLLQGARQAQSAAGTT